MVVDGSKAAASEVEARNKEAGRHGLECVHADIGTPGLALPGHGAHPPAFDFAVEKVRAQLYCVAMRTSRQA